MTGGGLTVIANAPNPAGLAILKGSFEDESVSPLGLLLAALPPTCVAVLPFGTVDRGDGAMNDATHPGRAWRLLFLIDATDRSRKLLDHALELQRQGQTPE